MGLTLRQVIDPLKNTRLVILTVAANFIIVPKAMDLQFWPGAVVMMLIATLTASLMTNSGRSAWFVGVLVLMVYLIFALTLCLMPPRGAVKQMWNQTQPGSKRTLAVSDKSIKSCLSRLAVCLVLGTLPSDVDDGAI